MVAYCPAVRLTEEPTVFPSRVTKVAGEVTLTVVPVLAPIAMVKLLPNPDAVGAAKVTVTVPEKVNKHVVTRSRTPAVGSSPAMV